MKETPEFYKRFYQFSQLGHDAEESSVLAGSDVNVEDYEEALDYIQDYHDHQSDLVERGFYYGTDDPRLVEQYERGEAMQDKIDMYMNEY